MPEKWAFLKGFGVKKSLMIGKWQIQIIDIGHTVLARFKEYSFPMTITAVCKGKEKADGKQFIADLQEFVDKKKGVIVNSQFGNPYSCVFGEISLAPVQSIDQRAIIVKATGNAIRVYK